MSLFMLEAYNLMIKNDELDLDDDEDFQDECGSSCNEEDDDLMDDSEVEDDIDTFGI